MSVFASLFAYAGKYEPKNEIVLTNEEIAEVKSAKIVESEYGLSVCFFMKAGCQKYIPVSRDYEDQVSIGDAVDLTKIKILTLSKEGAKDIKRVTF